MDSHRNARSRTARCRPRLGQAPIVFGLLAFSLLTTTDLNRPTAASEARAGFFRVARTGDAWSFVDPQGRKFISLGINVIDTAEDEKVKAPKYDGLARHGGAKDKWQAFTLSRLDSWNFNTIGAWSSLRGRPYVLELSLSYSWIDIFDPAFETYVRKAALEVLRRPDVAADYATLAKDPLLIGYFTDNELAWGWDYGWSDKKGSLSLFEYYATLGPETPGKKAWASYLLGSYGSSFKELRKVWAVEVETEADLLGVKRIAPRGPHQHAKAERLADGFLKRAAERYFEVTSRVMRTHLPNHMNLGTRLTPRFPATVAETAGKYVDVLSINIYSRDLDFIKSELARLHKAGGKPIVVTEFSFAARQNRSGNKNRGYEQTEVEDEKQRGENYARLVQVLGDMPFMLGCHWFQYFDQPPHGRADGESVNFGFVDLNDRVYEDLARLAAEANARVLQRRGGIR